MLSLCVKIKFPLQKKVST